MIRLVLILLFLIIVWLLFVAKISRMQRITAVVCACLLFAGAVWFDDNRKRPKPNLLSVDAVRSCGLLVAPPYRSNYDFSLCFRNEAQSGKVKRLTLDVTGKLCGSAENEPCKEIETVRRDLPVTIEPGQTMRVKQSLKFDRVAALKSSDDNIEQNLQWSVKIASVKATPN